MERQAVAILGLGLMGSGMAARLLERGFAVAVWNRSAAKAAALGEAGARVAATPAEAARGADIVLAMLADDDASRTGWLGPDGALAAMAPGSIAIDSGTLTPAWIATLAGEAAARDIAFLDAPVTGTRPQAAAGTLRFLVGGDAETIARARPALDAMGSEIAHLGPVGSGAMTKLLNNFLCGVQIASVAEALAMAERSGLDPAATVKVWAEGAPGSPVLTMLAQRMLARDYAPNFLPALMAKDMAYAAATFAAAGIALPSAEAARARFLAAAATHGDRDMASVIEPLRREGEGGDASKPPSAH